MCKRCDDEADRASSLREDEPCEVGDHDYGEAADWPAGLVADSEIHCQNCGWSMADIKAKEQADIDSGVA